MPWAAATATACRICARKLVCRALQDCERIPQSVIGSGRAPHSPGLSQTCVPLQLAQDVALASTAGKLRVLGFMVLGFGRAPHSPRLSQTCVPLQLGPDVALAGTAGRLFVKSSLEPVQSRSWFWQCRERE